MKPQPQEGKEPDPLYTHYKLELKNMSVEWNYTICESLKQVMDNLKFLDVYLDDDTTSCMLKMAAFFRFRFANQ